MTILAACGGGGDSGNIAGGGRGGDSIGFLTLSITDAPIDNAIQVWVQINSVLLKHEASSVPMSIPFDPPKNVELLSLQGQNSVLLLENEIVPSGNYNWIKLNVTAVKDGSTEDSKIVLKSGAEHELEIPSGNEDGLKIIGGLHVGANTPTEMTVDINLRDSIDLSGIDYKLRPVMKLVEDELTGTIRGTIKKKLVTDDDCTGNPATGEGNAVYLYKGFDVEPDDDDSAVDPEHIAPVTVNPTSGQYEYEFGLIPFGNYTIAFTCEAGDDLREADDDIEFNDPKNIRVAKTKPQNVPLR